MYQFLLLKTKFAVINLYLEKNVGVIAWLLNYYIIIKLLLLGVQYFRHKFIIGIGSLKNNSFYLNNILKKCIAFEISLITNNYITPNYRH